MVFQRTEVPGERGRKYRGRERRGEGGETVGRVGEEESKDWRCREAGRAACQGGEQHWCDGGEHLEGGAPECEVHLKVERT